MKHFNITFIGAGNVATHLGLAFKKEKHTIIQVFSRTENSAKQLAKKLSCDFTTDIQKILSGSDIYILALKDDAIEKNFEQLSQIFSKREDMKKPIFIHTSGSVSIKNFKQQTNYGVFYPLQTFSKNRKFNFAAIPICIEANNKKTEKILIQLAKTISKKIYLLNSEQRKMVHIAAVFANNFTNHLCAIAEKILEKEHISFDILKPLLEETFNKIKNNSPSEMQTGPAIRGDKKIIKEHLKLLSAIPSQRKIYKLLSEAIQND